MRSGYRLLYNCFACTGNCVVCSSSATIGKSSGKIVERDKIFFLMWTLTFFFFLIFILRAVAVWQHCVKQHFEDANGAAEILSTIRTHDGEGHVVISEVIVQNKDRSKCIWTQELFLPRLSFLGLLRLFLSPDASSSSFLHS